ncbi:trans-aconitate 2-methyltransferase [Pseudorhodoplanes sinuspersici]|uniref:Trans-aconitate 2-methyltransferase n=1 Tax=Pseudorhodoplanes sinuspersici TaxID=1235591 RepID=A0A1W6ZKN6_9HYPH|nr:trans-aconitate 2-methyltransferase [Pseudorhodoplanes sinuspersici]ARP97983.1 trans-aconitate 2-methyltransferase [Pseudorhodoplanes sinuspersici]RKE68263.1 trans-aconitate 2-methyltransferase [Pseudorhodoplanes sinuspersici]
MADWNAQQYLKFEDERSRPARDLLAQVPLTQAGKIFDLGCGPGNSTQLLAERFPDAAITGVDSSPDMLRQARERLPHCSFVQADLNDWSAPDDTDLLFSNATFQWLPDHVAVLQRLLKTLKSGAILAMQVPDNWDEPNHVWMRELAREEPWVKLLPPNPRDRMSLPSVHDYYDRIRPHCARIDIWHCIYEHVLDGPEAIVELVKGTGLRPFIDPLPPEQRQTFIEAYTARIAAAYPLQMDGKVLLRFPRLFMVMAR